MASSSQHGAQFQEEERTRREHARGQYAALGSRLQSNQVAKFEVQHLPPERKIFLKKGSLLFLTPRDSTIAQLDAQDRELRTKQDKMRALAGIGEDGT
ncbi:unnamed protein product [Discosporangium mesarthrocarpum]